jgi:hypothetical protein
MEILSSQAMEWFIERGMEASNGTYDTVTLTHCYRSNLLRSVLRAVRLCVLTFGFYAHLDRSIIGQKKGSSNCDIHSSLSNFAENSIHI